MTTIINARTEQSVGTSAESAPALAERLRRAGWRLTVKGDAVRIIGHRSAHVRGALVQAAAEGDARSLRSVLCAVDDNP